VDHADRVAAVRGLARAARFLDRACGDLTLAQYRVLSAVDSGEARASRIARGLAMGKPAVSNAVDGLCQRGLLERAADDDQRVVALQLTAAGQQALREAEHAMAAWLDDVVDRAGGQPVLDAFVAFNAAMGNDRVERMVR
jgi:DNA-binding MarR family transcriptional regulator